VLGAWLACSGGGGVGEATHASASASQTASTSGSGGAAPMCSPTIASIQETIFAKRCAGSMCHTASYHAGELDLVSPGVDKRLVDVTSATCAKLRVLPGRPELSFLYEKVSGKKPECGDAMPVAGTLSAADKACIEKWIAGLPPGCDTCGTAACIDMTNDAKHCGACNKACTVPGTSCKASVCTCDNGGTVCNGKCVDTQSDGKNCGKCNNYCSTFEACKKGVCSTDCGTLTQCVNSCFDITQNHDNCGGCDKPCAAKESCIDSKCQCPGAGDFMVDGKNCGGCGIVCAPAETCVMGKCTCGNASVSFASAVQPILTNNCATAGCHSGMLPKESLSLEPGKSYAGLVNVASMQCNDGRMRVKPGSPSKSYLIDKIAQLDICTGSKMPAAMELDSPDIVTIANWICAGAPNN
jgi:hypothetical protein